MAAPIVRKPKPIPLNGARGGDPAGKSLLKLRAYDELKQWIQDASIPPGAFLSERQLATRLGMSKTPVKAALERLEAEGFLAVSPQQGIVVRDLALHEIVDQFEIRLALETFVLRAVAGRLKADEANSVREMLRMQERAAAKRDISGSIKLDADFHLMFCVFLGNQEIIRVMSQLREKIHRVISRAFSQDAERMVSSFREHAAIAKAVLDGDPDGAARAILDHLDYGKQILLSPRRR